MMRPNAAANRMEIYSVCVTSFRLLIKLLGEDSLHTVRLFNCSIGIGKQVLAGTSIEAFFSSKCSFLFFYSIVSKKQNKTKHKKKKNANCLSWVIKVLHTVSPEKRKKEIPDFSKDNLSIKSSSSPSSSFEKKNKMTMLL